MDLKVFKDEISSMTSLCECRAELPVETEILVPDYMPQVFKIVKCFVKPVVLKKQAGSGQLVLEGYLRCIVYYQAEDEQSLCQTEQKLPFNKTLEIPETAANKIIAFTDGEVEYLNCRAVNQRRIDIRGAFALRAVISAQEEPEVITALSDCGIEQKLTTLSAAKCMVNLDKLITTEEEIVLPQIPQAVLDISGIGHVGEIKLISGKAVVKGTVQVNVTYRNEPGCKLENAEKTVPFNQIIDIEDVPEDSVCFAQAEMIGCTMTTAGQEGANTLTVTVMLHLRVINNTECCAVKDAFSTCCTTENKLKKVQCEQLKEKLDKTAQANAVITLTDENAELIGAFSTLNQTKMEAGADGAFLSGRGIVHLLCRNSLGELDCYDKPFEYQLSGIYAGSPEEYRLECWPEVVELKPEKAGDEIKIKLEIQVSGLLFQKTTYEVVDSVDCLEMLENKEPDIALRIYYAQAGENLFEIAKNYHVSPQTMMRLNQLEEQELAEACQLLVPVTV